MAEGKSNLTESPAERSLKLERVFDAPRKLVYEAWTKKEHLDKWFSPRGFTIRESNAEFRVGGKWHSLMIAPDGEHYPECGVYQRIVPEKLLVMTHTWVGDDGKPEHETIMTLRFEDAGVGSTKLTMEQSIFKSVASRDSHVGGWTECLDKLGELLAELRGKA
jgi:uncharacterized protein YndB with AHSA1/START domain